MNGKSINFNDKKIKKVTFIIKTKKIVNIDDINANKILVSKKKHTVNIIPPNTLLGMIMSMIRPLMGMIRPLYLFISQTTGDINKFDKSKITMCLID